MTRTINNTINRFTAQFEILAECGNDFCAYDDDTINYCFILPDYEAKCFMKAIKRLNPFYDYDVFIWLLLHEIGHIMMDTVTTRFKWVRTTVELVPCRWLRNQLYNLLPAERKANAWAVRYANTHYHELKKLEREVLTQFQQFVETLEENAWK